MKYSARALVLLLILGFNSPALAVCKEPENIGQYKLSADLKANQVYIDSLREYEQCLSGLFKRKYDSEFVKKYNQQRAEEAVIWDRILEVNRKKQDILNPFGLYLGLYMTDEEYRGYLSDQKKFDKEKADAAIRLGLDSNKQIGQ